MTQSFPLPFNAPPYQNVDQVALSNTGVDLIDGYIDDTPDGKVSIRRPGLDNFISFQTGLPVDGSFWWDKKKIAIFVSGGRIFKIETLNGVFIELTGDKLNGNLPSTFASNGEAIVIANGDNMVFTDGTSLTETITGDFVPQDVSHVVFLDFFILAFEGGTDLIRFADFTPGFTGGVPDPSNPSGFPTLWKEFDDFSAERSPDGLTSLTESRRILLAGGMDSIEFFVLDNNGIFQRLQGTELDFGLMSNFSIVNVNGIYYLFDDTRRLRVISGSISEILNTSFDELIQTFDVVSDATIDYVTKKGKRWLLIHFPTEDRTLFYDLDGKYWAQWSFLNPNNQVREIFLGAGSYVYAKGFNKHYFGSVKDGTLFEMNDDSFEDDGNPIHFLKTTGFISLEDPTRRKSIEELRINVKRGLGKGIDNSQKLIARLSFRDCATDEFGTPYEIDLGAVGENALSDSIFDMGPFKQRQFKIEMSDPGPFILVGATMKAQVEEY